MVGATTLVYGALVAISLAGGPLRPQELQFPGFVNNVPAAEPQQPTSKPGAKNTPVVNRPAKKVNDSGQTGAVPSPSGVPAVPVPTASAPATAGTSPAPTTQPSTDPTTSPQPTTEPSPSASPTGTQPGETGTAEPSSSATMPATGPTVSLALTGVALGKDPVTSFAITTGLALTGSISGGLDATVGVGPA